MAITNYLVHFLTEDTYNSKKSELRNDAVAFVKDATIIHTHGTDYYCGSGPVALKSDLENLDKICFIDLVSELNLDITHILEGNYSPVSSTAEAGTFQKMLTAIQNNQQIVGIHNIQEDPNFINLRFESSFVQANTNAIFMYLYNSAYIMILTITPQEEVNLTYAGLLTTDQNFNGSKVLVSGGGQIVDESDITTTELNYLDGVTSNIQTQLNGKAASSHNHSAANITSGTLDIARIPTGTSASTVALGNHTHNNYATTSQLDGYLPLTGGTVTGNLTFDSNGSTGSISVNDNGYFVFDSGGTQYEFIDGGILIDSDYNVLHTRNFSNYVTPSSIGAATESHTHSASDITSGTLALARIPTGTTASTVALGNHTHSNYLTSSSLSGYATQSWVNNQLTSYLTKRNSGLTLTWQNSSLVFDHGEFMPGETGIALSWTGSNYEITVDTGIVLTSENYSDYISSTDTKNTTGTSNSTSKLFLAGGTSQSPTGVVTYSNLNVYTQSGQLYATQMNATNGFYETSDARLKNFKDDIKALNVVSEIPTKYFTWKKEEVAENRDPVLHIGTSAQEIQKFYPDLVTENEEGILSVDYAKLSIIAIAAIKELKEEINELKAKLQ